MNTDAPDGSDEGASHRHRPRDTAVTGKQDDAEDHADSGDAHRVSPAHILDPRLRFEGQRALVWAAVIGLFAFAVFISHSLLVIFGALVFAAMLDGGARLLGRVLPVGRRWRVALILLLTAAFLYWLATFAGAQIAREASELPSIVQDQLGRLENWASRNGVGFGLSQLQSFSGQVMSGVGTLTRALTGIAGGVTTIILIVIIGIYVAFEPRLYERGVEWFAPREHRSSFSVTLDRMAHTLRRLMAGRLLGMAVEGVFTWIALAIAGVPMAALLGILTGLLAFIPNIGAFVSGLLMVLVGLSVDFETALYAFGIYLFVQTFDGYVVIPMIARKTVDLAPALVLGFQLIMGIVFGILGLLLADPLMAMIKVALERRAEETEDAENMVDGRTASGIASGS